MDEYQEYMLLKTHHYAIVDATMRDEIPSDWEQAIIAPVFLGKDTGRCPLLIDLQSIDDDDKEQWIKRLIEETHALEATWCSLLLASDAPIDKLAKHLAQRLVLKIAGEESPKQFRYFDPGTFLQLPDILGDDGMTWLMGPITSIGIPWVGEFVQYNKPDNKQLFRLKPPHYDRLFEMSVVNRILLHFDREPPSNQAAWVSTAQSVRQTVQRGLEYGLTDVDNLMTFCIHALDYHPRFDEHPRLQDVFATLANATEEDELDYRFLTQPLKNQDWQAIVGDLKVHDMQLTE